MTLTLLGEYSDRKLKMDAGKVMNNVVMVCLIRSGISRQKTASLRIIEIRFYDRKFRSYSRKSCTGSNFHWAFAILKMTCHRSISKYDTRVQDNKFVILKLKISYYHLNSRWSIYNMYRKCELDLNFHTIVF